MSSRSTVLLSALRLVLIGLIAVLIFAFYIQTRHGFRHVIMPVMSSTLPDTFTIRDGYLRLRGSLELDVLRYSDKTAGVAVEAQRVFVSLSPSSLVRDRILLVRDLQIEGATVSLSQAQAQSVESTAMPAPPGGNVLPITPVVIEQGRVKDLTVVILDDPRTITAEGATLEFTQLGPARHGSIGLRANLRLDQPSQEVPWIASVTLDAAVEMNQAGTVAKWTGSNRFGLMERRAGPTGAESEVIVVDQSFAGEYDHASRTVQSSSRLTASKGKVALGSAAVTLATTHSGKARTVDV